MLIFLRQTNGNGMQLQVDQDDKISLIFKLLNNLQHVKDQQIILMSKGQILTSFQLSFSQLKIKSDQIIHIIKRNKNDIKICQVNICVFYNDQIYCLRINNQQSCLKLKFKVYEITGVLPKEQVLIFRGIKLIDDQKIHEQNLDNNSLITLVSMLKKSTQNEQINCQYHVFKNNIDLQQSVKSIQLKKKLSYSLFRSDSIGIKTMKSKQFPQIEIKYNRVYNPELITASIQSQKQLQRMLNSSKNQSINDLVDNIYSFNQSKRQISPKKQTSQKKQISQKIQISSNNKSQKDFLKDINNVKYFSGFQQINDEYIIQNTQENRIQKQQGINRLNAIETDSLYKKLKLPKNSLLQSLQFNDGSDYSQIQLQNENCHQHITNKNLTLQKAQIKVMTVIQS